MRTGELRKVPWKPRGGVLSEVPGVRVKSSGLESVKLLMFYLRIKLCSELAKRRSSETPSAAAGDRNVDPPSRELDGDSHRFFPPPSLPGAAVAVCCWRGSISCRKL